MPAARALTRRVTPARGRAAVRAACAAAAILALAGCSQVDQVNAALAKQWAVVNFKPDTTVSTLLQVRATCSRVPHVRPVRGTDMPGHLNVTYSVRYEVSRASGHNLAALRTCLAQFKAVSGVSFQDVSGQS